MTRPVTLALVGDVLINRDHPDTALAGVRSVLAAADLVVGNFEGVLSTSNDIVPGRDGSTVALPSNVKGLSDFDVLCLANNHSLDGGYGGLRDTLRILGANGIKHVGAGDTLDEAWRPVIVKVGDISVAILSVAAVYKIGYDATELRGGVAALGSTDHYAPRFPGSIVPGVAPNVTSVVRDVDWKRMAEHVERAMKEADLVAVSMHWGDHTSLNQLTAFERDIASRLRELGVSLVFGHHHHSLRAVDLNRNTAVLYGLGHIAFDQPKFAANFRERHDVGGWTDSELEARFGSLGYFPRASGFPFPEPCRWSTIALVKVSPGEIPSVSLVPVWIDDTNSATLLTRGAQRWNEYVARVQELQVEASGTARVEDRGSQFAGVPILDVLTLN